MIVGTLLIPNLDYGKTVSAVDIKLNGSQIEVVYLDAGQLKADSISCVYSWSDALSAHVAVPAMSGCTIDDFRMIDIDGNIYDVIRIGNQLWTVQNLKVTKLNDGTPITEVINGNVWENLTSAGRCWYNNNGGTYSATYGSLYNWYAVNTGKLAPAGWRVPTSADWKVLSDFLGGDSVAGGKIKETGTTHWEPPNTGATNESGFSALPGGYRYYQGGNFYGQSYHSFWWSSTEYNASNAYFRGIHSDNSDLVSYDNVKSFGFSVRLVKE